MSSLIYPASLPGLTYNSSRSPTFNTGIQQALSGKESRIAYQQFTLMQWELQYELLRDYVSPSDLKALVGLFIAVQGKWDTFLYNDPVFNAATNMPFGVTDGTNINFPVTATYENAGGPGGAELIQNFNGTPVFALNRYSELLEYFDYGAARTQFYLQSNSFSASALSGCTLASSSFLSPDGFTHAMAMNANTSANVQHYADQSFSAPGAGQFTFSVFAVAFGVAGGGDARYLWLQVNDGSSGVIAACFDLNGVGNGAVISAAVTSVGNLTNPVAEISPVGSFYRVSLSFTKAGTAAASAYILPSSSSASTSYAGTSGTAGAFIWGAQFENFAASPPAGGEYPSMYLPAAGAPVTQADASLGPTGILTLTSPLAAGWNLAWSGAFHYRVRFDDDSMDVVQFMANFWSLAKLRLKQIKL